MSDASDRITIPIVLAWDLSHLDNVVTQLRAAIPLIEAEFNSADSEYSKSSEFFKGPAGDTARQQSVTEKSDGIKTVDVIELLPDIVSSINSTFRSEIAKIRTAVADVKSSKWDLFYEANGDVASRKSNWETAKEHWWDPVTAVAKKEKETHDLKSDLKDALMKIRDTDLTETKISQVLESLSDAVKTGMANIPSDPELARILLENQINKDKMVIWPDGIVLDALRLKDPNFTPSSMSESEAKLLESLIMQKGIWNAQDTLNEFQDLKLKAENAGKAGEYEISQFDGQGDAVRHAYWNALMTDKYGEDFAKSFATAHEGIGGPANREAMDLYNNNIGRQIALENPGASADELRSKVEAAVNDGKMIVVSAANPQAPPQITWSNQVAPQDTGQTNGYGVPLPAHTK